MGRGPSRFLVAAIDGGGTLPPVMGVAADLVRRGHRVHVLADPTAEEAARAAAGLQRVADGAACRSVAEQTDLVPTSSAAARCASCG